MTRATYLTFFGKPRGAAAGEHHGDDEHAEEHDDGAHLGGRCRAPIARRGDDARTTRTATTTTMRPTARTSRPLLLIPIVILASSRCSPADQPDAVASRSAKASRRSRSTSSRVDSVPSTTSSPPAPASRSRSSTAARLLRRVPKAKAAKAAASEVRLRLRRPGVGHGVLRPLGHPCRAQVRQDPALARGRRARLAVAIAFNVAFYGRRNKRLVGLTERNRCSRGGLPVPGEQVLPRRPLRERHRPRRRPPDRQGRLLDQPARPRRHRQRRRQVGARRTGDWVYHNIDQRVVDGAVNGSGWIAAATGPALQPTAIRQGQSVRSAAVRCRSSRCARPRPRQRELKATQPWNHSLIRTGC